MSQTVEFIISLNDKFSKKLGKASGAVNKLDKSIKKTTPGISGLGKQLAGLASIAAIGAVFVNTARDVAQYEKNIASLGAITGTSGDVLKGFQNQVNLVAKDTKASSVAVAKAFELVGSAKPELLASAAALGEVTKMAIVLSEASGETLESSVQSLAGTMNQFGLGAEKAGEIINILAAGSKEGAAAVPLISQSLDKFGTVAASMNVSVAESVGLIETLAEKNIKGAEAGTALRNVLVKMGSVSALPAEALKQLEKFGVDLSVVSNKALPVSQRLKELGKIAKDDTALFKVFGAENLVAGGILLNNSDKVQTFNDKLTGTSIAFEQQAKNNATLTKRLEQLGNAWTNLFTSSDQANGVLSVISGTIAFLADNLSAVITVLGIATGVFVAYKLGVMLASLATAELTIAQGALNAVMALNPVGLIVAGIAVLIGLITTVIVKFDTWGAALGIILGPIGMVISLIQAFRRNWDDIKKSFNDGGMVQGFKKIGNVILDALIMPLEQLFGLMANLPGIGTMAAKIAGKLGSLREGFGVNTGGGSASTSVKAVSNSSAAAGIASNPISAIASASSAAKSDLSSKSSSITSAAPKTFNLSINQLVGEITNNNQTITENMAEATDIIKQALLGSLNDVQTELG